MSDYVEVPLLPDADGAHGGRFVYGVADQVGATFTAAATVLQEYSNAKKSWVQTGLDQFQGHYAEVFAANANRSELDVQDLANGLNLVGKFMGTLTGAAHEEDSRRRRANEWVHRHNNKNGLDVAHDFFFGEDARPNMDTAKAPVFPVTEVHGKARQEFTASPGSSGVSSGDPDHLNSFVSQVNGNLSDVSALHGKLVGVVDEFRSQCSWAGLDVSSLLSALVKFVQAEHNDAKWASTIAAAFRAAGGGRGSVPLSDASLGAALAKAGLPGSRQVIDFAAPTAYGALPSTGYANDPVNTFTGNFIEPEVDLEFTGVAGLLRVERMYNSVHAHTQHYGADHTTTHPEGGARVGVFGVGWSSTLDQRLEVTGEGVVWVREDGRHLSFPPLNPGVGVVRGAGENTWLEQGSGADERLVFLGLDPSTRVLVVTDNQGAWAAYSATGAWLGSGTGMWDVVRVERDHHQLVKTLIHARGRRIEVAYTDLTVGPRVSRVTGSDARTVGYTYDGQDNLCTVTPGTVHTTEQKTTTTPAAVSGGVREYVVDGDGLIARVVDSGVVEVVNEYDDAGRVVAQVSELGRRSVFSYVGSGVTQVSDPDGSRSNTWIADGKGRLVGAVDAGGYRQSFSYDPYSNLVRTSYRDGSSLVRKYDERGHVVRERGRWGGIYEYEWDGLGRLTQVSTTVEVTASDTTSIEGTSAGSESSTSEVRVVTRFEFEGTGREPVRVVGPAGGVTHLVWEQGLLSRVVDPVGVWVHLSYNGFGELIAVENAVGVFTLTRDEYSQITQVRTPSGALTRFEYDTFGNVISRVDPDGGVYRFTYDTGGRLATLTDPAGGSGRVVYGAHGEAVSVIDPLGRTTSRVLDDLGNTVETLFPDGARWLNRFDGLSRLTEIMNPAGGVTQFKYERDGGLASVENAVGVKVLSSVDVRERVETLRSVFGTTRTRFDVHGRPTTVAAEPGAETRVLYGKDGFPAHLIDGEGNTTGLVWDVAGKLVSVTDAGGGVSGFEYDEAGRPLTQIGPSGERSWVEYDLDSQVIALHTPTQTTRFIYDVMGRVVEVRDPVDGVSRYKYDRCARLVYAQDRAWGTRRFTYNLAGDVSSVRNGVGGITRFEYDECARVSRVISPSGGITSYEYTLLGQVCKVSDPLGRITQYTYDVAGNLLTTITPDHTTQAWTREDQGKRFTHQVNDQIVSCTVFDPSTGDLMVTDNMNPAKQSEHVFSFTPSGQLTTYTTSSGNSSSDGGGRVCQTWDYTPTGRVARHRVETGVLNVNTTFTHTLNGALTRITSDTPWRNGNVLSLSETGGPGSFAFTATTSHAGTRPGASSSSGWEATWTHTTTDGVESGTGIDSFTLTGQSVIKKNTDCESMRVERDVFGRPTTITTPNATVLYEYDGAGQLIQVSTDAGDGGRTTHSFVYDVDGRLVQETTNGVQVSYAYDVAGQLVSMTRDGLTTRYGYDLCGRREWQSGPDEVTTRFGWSPAGVLESITWVGLEGQVLEQVSVHADALGNLVEVNGVPLVWDINTPTGTPVLAAIGDTPITSVGGFTAINGHWQPPGYRLARNTNPGDPYTTQTLTTETLPIDELPAMLSLTNTGGVSVAGFEVLGARLYDPGTRSFLTPDPLPPITGAGWAGNPYAYAGNNPVTLLDPTGLRPLTDSDLKKLDQQRATGLFPAIGDWAQRTWSEGVRVVGQIAQGVGNWWSHNWEYVVAGAAIAGGVALMFTGVGGVAGIALMAASGALISGGFSVASQKATTGTVDWGQVGIDTAVGAVGGAAGGGAAMGATRALQMWRVAPGASKAAASVWKIARSSFVREGVSSVAETVTGNVASYGWSNHAQSPEEFWGGMGQATVTGLGFGAVTPGANRFLRGKYAGAHVAEQFPRFVPSWSTSRHAVSQVNLTQSGVDWVADRVSGAAAGWGNAYFQPESNDAGRFAGAGSGAVQGGAGETMGLHSGFRWH